MVNELVVLWLLLLNPWRFGLVPMSPGWIAAAVLDPHSCAEALTRARGPAMCATPGITPAPVSTRVEEEEWI